MDLQHKQFSIEDFKATEENGVVSIEGYANVKGKADRYGDVPTAFPAVRDYVYELKNFLKNPVALLDHNNSTEAIVGSFNPKMGGYIGEDDVGLKFKLVFTRSEFPPVAHARKVYQEGHGRALSIGGKWYYEDKDNPTHLTLAEIFEISLVGVGADPDALSIKMCDTCPNRRNLQEVEGTSKEGEGKIKITKEEEKKWRVTKKR